MSRVFRVFASDDLAVVSFNQCFLPSSECIEESSKYVQVHTARTLSSGGQPQPVESAEPEPTVVLRVVFTSAPCSENGSGTTNGLQMDQGHALIHLWVMDLLGLKNGDEVELVSLNMDTVDATSISSVSLQFVGSMNLLNYDDYTTHFDFSGSNELKLPSTWQSDWPDLSVSALSTMMSTLLHNSCLVSGGYVCINALEHDMVFQTFLNISGHPTEETDNFHLQKCFIVNGFDTEFDIVSTQIDSIIEPVKYVETDTRYVAPTINPFMDGAFRKLNKIVYESLRHSCSSCKAGDAWIGPHSSLVMSGPGSGKSYLLREIITDISSKFISFRSVRDCSTDHPPFVFILSGDCAANFDSIKLSQDNTSMSLSRDDTTIHQFLLRILSLLVNFLPELRLGNEKRQPNFHESQLQKISDIVLKDGFLPPICVVIDNADDLLRSTDDSTSSSSAVEVGNSSKLASYYLRQLLAQLNTPACPHPVCVLAATSCTIRSDVAPYFLGPPGFESIVTLPLPSLTDRFLLFKTFLEDSCGSEELESVLGDLPLRFVSISHEENSLGELASDEQENSSMRNKLGCRSKFVFDWVMRASSLTAGYLPIDLKNIIKRAWNLNSNSDGTTIPPKSPTNDNFTDKKLLWSNFLAALTATTPAQLRSVAMSEGGSSGGIVVESRDSTLSWEDFAGYANEKKAISQILERSNPLYGKKMKMQESEARSNLIRAVGHHAPKGLILYGPSGCGKTHMARIIAAECKMNFITVKSTAILSKFFGETEATLRRLFQKARDAAPCVLFFDEFDAIAHNRSEDGDGETSVMARVLSTFLNELDGISSLGLSDGMESELNVFVLAASERLSNLDQALLRPGRLSHHVKLGLPTCEDIGSLLRFFCKKLPLGDDVCLDEVVRLCTDRLRGGDEGSGSPSCAAVSALTREAVQIALRERIVAPSTLSSLSLDLSGYTINDNVDGCLHQKHFLSAIELLLPDTMSVEIKQSSSLLSVLPPFEFKTDSMGTGSGGSLDPAASKTEFKFDGSFSLGSKV